MRLVTLFNSTYSLDLKQRPCSQLNKLTSSSSKTAREMPSKVPHTLPHIMLILPVTKPDITCATLQLIFSLEFVIFLRHAHLTKQKRPNRIDITEIRSETRTSRLKKVSAGLIRLLTDVYTVSYLSAKFQNSQYGSPGADHITGIFFVGPGGTSQEGLIQQTLQLNIGGAQLRRGVESRLRSPH